MDLSADYFKVSFGFIHQGLNFYRVFYILIFSEGISYSPDSIHSAVHENEGDFALDPSGWQPEFISVIVTGGRSASGAEVTSWRLPGAPACLWASGSRDLGPWPLPVKMAAPSAPSVSVARG